MARCDLTCLTNRGNRISRMVTTRKTIASTQLSPARPDSAGGSPKSQFHSACHCSMTNEMAVYSQSSNGGLLVRPAGILRGGSVGRAAGRPG